MSKATQKVIYIFLWGNTYKNVPTRSVVPILEEASWIKNWSASGFQCVVLEDQVHWTAAITIKISPDTTDDTITQLLNGLERVTKNQSGDYSYATCMVGDNLEIPD